ncbi:uncharacterized protein V1516DRAFT_673464 [Lipomyces oligophaga]|uniref:uncharacterized protein n=1 Tax=Lipomyces oligophaga TaxID=45792 RepID=UPI0034CD76A4
MKLDHSSLEDTHERTRPAQYVSMSTSRPILAPKKVRLSDGRTATFYAFFRADENDEIELCVSDSERAVLSERNIDSFVSVLHKLLNDEIEGGQTYPQLDLFSFAEFKSYWFATFTAILVLDSEESTNLASIDAIFADADERVLATFYTKPNYPGRCSHVCNGAFLVSPKYRGMKIGKLLGTQFLEWAPKLGFKSSIFNLVFETNIASWKTWDSLGFERVGVVKNAVYIKGIDGPVNAIIFGFDFTKI